MTEEKVDIKDVELLDYDRAMVYVPCRSRIPIEGFISGPDGMSREYRNYATEEELAFRLEKSAEIDLKRGSGYKIVELHLNEADATIFIPLSTLAAAVKFLEDTAR